MRSNSEPNCFFGGMAVPSWQSSDKAHWASDPAEYSSWLFKIELEGEQLTQLYNHIDRLNLHQWKCIQKNRAIVCNKSYFLIIRI